VTKPLIAAAAAALATAGIAAATSLGISGAVSQPPAADVDGCPKVILYFSRGSGQDLDTNAQRHHEQLYGGDSPEELGLANPGFQLYKALAGKYGDANVGAMANAYPAQTVTLRLGKYLASVDRGVGSAERNIADLVRLCPRSQLVLGGFSQGAQVLHIALANLTQGEQDHIAAVMLFGDPYFSAHDPVVKAEPAAKPKLDPNPSKQGIAFYAFHGRYPPIIGSAYKGKVFSWCHLFDPVCQVVNIKHPFKSIRGVTVHKAYEEEIPSAASEIEGRLRASGIYPEVNSPTTASHSYRVANTCHGGTCGVAEWSGPGSAGYESVGALHEHQLIDVACQITGEAVSGANGGESAIWDRLSNGAFVADYYVDTPGVGVPTPSIPRCQGLSTGSP
jgi:hypothetical protein